MISWFLSFSFRPVYLIALSASTQRDCRYVQRSQEILLKQQGETGLQGGEEPGVEVKQEMGTGSPCALQMQNEQTF